MSGPPRDTDAGQLRRRALATIPKWIRSIYPPSLDDAECGLGGHPIFTALDGEIFPLYIYTVDDASATANERDRHNAATRKAGDSAMMEVAQASAAMMDPWFGLAFTLIAQAINLMRWHVGNDQRLLRTDGELHLLAHQVSACSDFWFALTGSCVAPSRSSALRKPLFAEVLAPTDQDVAMPDGVLSALAYLGTSPPDDTGETHIWLAKCVTMATRLWPTGMRVTRNAYPDAEWCRPWAPDVTAWWTISSLSPRRDKGGTSIHRARFLDALIKILSIAGTFDSVMEAGGYVTVALVLEHYPFCCLNVTASQVVAWLVQHGIAPGGSAILVLESFGRARRNRTDGGADPSGQEFATSPMNEAEMRVIGRGSIAAWTALAHGPLRDGVTSSYPRSPGAPPVKLFDGIAGPIHAEGSTMAS
ncbi:hypothetical protein C8J57DRAFT_1533822 [Mycena rebaudengoi]|nr:hypothetical protein C8J57DRAFT_1533822 [Mycena rebaudengoi]